MALSLCACGNSGNTPTDTPNPTGTPNDTQTAEPSNATEDITAESLAGTYKANLWFIDHSITLNANTTYDFGTTEKGTFKLDENAIDFYNKEGYVNRQYLAGENCIYSIDESWVFDGDEDYNLAFSPDENGMADQTFIGNSLDAIPGCDYNWIVLDLNTDGSFALNLGNRSNTAVDVAETFEGTYTSHDSTLILTYDGQDYPLILNDSNQICFLVYNKI